MKRSFLAVAAGLVLIGGAALAQMNPGTGPGEIPRPNTNSPDITPDTVPSPAQKQKAKAAPDPQAVKRDAAALAQSAGISCAVTDAILVSAGDATVNGKQVPTKIYETACANGLGYFLVDQPPGPPMGLTCFSANAVHAADVAAGREAQPACSMPTHHDAAAMAATVLSKLGKACSVRDVRVIGVETNTKTELAEVACVGGTGYVIASPLPGSTAAVSALTCPESYRRNVPCKMSDNGAPMITLDTFKQALVQHNVRCTVENLRSIGRQNVSKRHVVEFKCPEQPNGLVAFIPLEEGAAPFETMDCPTAGSKQRIICTLTQIH